MNVLIQLQKKFAGCGFYRLFQPHYHLAKKELIKVTISTGIDGYSDEDLKKFDFIIWHKDFVEFKNKEWDKLADIRRAKSLGIVTIVDFDDHWVLNDKHTMYAAWMKKGLSAKLHKMILNADYVICSTDRLAEEIYEHNKNVVVIPNAVEETDVRNDRIPDEKYCFGYLGGMMHIRDVGLLEGLQKELTEKCKGYEFRLFGYNGTDVYKRYAEILSDYQRSKNFKLYEGLDIFHYYHFYNLMDCSLVPLENNSFNQYKSTLKMIEAGFFRKPVIVSNVAPYNDLINEKNCLKVNNKQDWFKYCKKLIDNPELGRELGEHLYQSVKKYSLENVNKSRFNFYQDVHKKHSSNSPVGAGRLEVVS